MMGNLGNNGWYYWYWVVGAPASSPKKMLVVVSWCMVIALASSTFNNSSSPVVKDKTALTTRLSGKNGLQIPRIGFGTAGLGQSTQEAVQVALDLGYNMIDTAQAQEWYSEESVGRGLRESRRSMEEVFVVTKVHPRSFAFSRLERDLERSHSQLCDTNSLLDLVLIHVPYCWPGHCTEAEKRHTWQQCWRNLEFFKSKGRFVSHLGVSNFDKALMEALLSYSNTQVAAVQNWCDPFHQDLEVREFAAKHNIVYMGYSSFGTQWSHKLGYNPVLESPVILDIATKHQVSASQVVLSWLLQEEVVSLPRSASPLHIRENSFIGLRNTSGGLNDHKDGKDIYECFLDHDDLYRIHALDGTLGVPWD